MENLHFLPGSLFANRFEIHSTAGSGGMGTVYRATDRHSGDIIALKLLNAGPGGHDEKERFAREALLLSELRHPGIVTHVAHGQTPDGQRFLAMEWLEGQDLGERLLRGPLPVQDCLRLVEQVADALSVSHQRGIIHRDLKPTNLFLIGGDVSRVKILDFGIARRIMSSQAMTRTGMVIGTPEYMAPEQARGSRDLTPAADLFSLGCILYECLAGQPPFVADYIAAVLVRILFEEPLPIEDRRPGIPAALSALLAHLLTKDPAQRLADAAALRIALLSLGELPEPDLAITMAIPKPKVERFAEQEQSLFSIVLAAPQEEDIGLGATQPGSGGQFAPVDRRALLQALTALGGSPDFLANGTLVVTVPPLGSAQDQATLAARAALFIKEQWPGVVVSMATGRGAVRGRTAVGEVVEKAAHLLKSGSHASVPDESSGVFADSLTAQLLAGRFTQTPRPGGALLLGEEREIDASRTLLGKPTPCMGRDPELVLLDSQLASCIEYSEPRVTLITASPGVGKSRLRHEFLLRLEKRVRPVTLLMGRGDMMSAGAAYAILRTAIHNLCGISGSEPLGTMRDRLRVRLSRHIAAADQSRIILFVGELCNIPFSDEGQPMLQAARQDPKIMRDSLRRALLDFIAAECAAGLVILVLDDLQWSDELTISVLDEALREQAAAPLFVLTLARPEVHQLFPRLWASHRPQEIPLKGLSKKACERLIMQVLGKEVAAEAVARAIEQSAGNALFLEESIRAIAEGKSEVQSETVLAMLQARLGRLDGNARRVVRAASVFGQTFWSGGVAAVLGQTATDPAVEHWLSELVDAELVQPHGQSRLGIHREYGFRHALVRDAAYSLLTDSDLATGHLQAAEFLAAACETNAAIIAEHFERSGDKQRASDYYLRAAEDSLERGDYAGAARQVDCGIGCGPDGEALGLLHSIGITARYYLNRFEGIAEAWTVALKLLRPGSLGWCRSIHGAIIAALGRQDAAAMSELLSLMLHTEPEPNARASYIETIGWVSTGLVVAAPDAMMQMIGTRLSAVVELAAQSTPAILRYLHFYEASMRLWRYPQPWRVLHVSREGLRLSSEVGDHKLFLGFSSAGIEYAWLQLGDLDGARQRLLSIEQLVTQNQERLYLGFWRHNLAWILCEYNDTDAWDQAEKLGDLLSADTSGMIFLPTWGQGILARVALLRGRMEEAERLARAAMLLFPVMSLWLTRTAAVQIRALIGLGQASQSTAVAEQVLAQIPMLGGAGFTEVEFRLAASEAFHAAMDFKRAHAELRETLRQIQLRADDIPEPFWRNSYLTRNPYCVRAQQLGKEWELTAP